MSKNNNLTDFLTSLANKIRNVLDLPADTKINPQNFESQIDLIAITSELKGFNLAQETFWDEYQNNGKRKNYNFAFAQVGWTDSFFKPKYPIYLDASSHNNAGDSVFYWATGLHTIDAEIIVDDTYPLDRYKGFEKVFLRCAATKIKSLDITNYNSTFNDWFNYCTKLKDITIIGKFKNSVNFSSCPLSDTTIEKWCTEDSCPFSSTASTKELILNDATKSKLNAHFITLTSTGETKTLSDYINQNLGWTIK